MKCTAPRRIASTASSMVPKPVISTTCACRDALFAPGAASSSTPDMPGMVMSDSTRCGTQLLATTLERFLPALGGSRTSACIDSASSRKPETNVGLVVDDQDSQLPGFQRRGDLGLGVRRHCTLLPPGRVRAHAAGQLLTVPWPARRSCRRGWHDLEHGASRSGLDQRQPPALGVRRFGARWAGRARCRPFRGLGREERLEDVRLAMSAGMPGPLSRMTTRDLVPPVRRVDPDATCTVASSPSLAWIAFITRLTIGLAQLQLVAEGVRDPGTPRLPDGSHLTPARWATGSSS